MEGCVLLVPTNSGKSISCPPAAEIVKHPHCQCASCICQTPHWIPQPLFSVAVMAGPCDLPVCKFRFSESQMQTQDEACKDFIRDYARVKGAGVGDGEG